MCEPFAVDSYVVYGKVGVCRVVERQNIAFGDRGNSEYYVLQPMSDSRAAVYIPCDNAELMARMRKPMQPEEIETLLACASAESMPWIDDRNGRRVAFREILSAGNQRQLLQMISCLYERKREKIEDGKALSSADESALQDAVRLLEEEFALALNLSRSDVAAYIREKLEK